MKDCPAAISIVGKSQAMQRAIQMIRLVAQSACNPILIVGETGTGKELAAQAVHLLRHGSDRKFVAINCAALTATLLESELFGHVKGAFTSADRDKTGLLELAGDGTIFLDEISEMQPDLQAKLLRVLQEKTFRKVGGNEEIECKATIIASSNRNLIKEVEKGTFRQDLYYRLSICPIMLSPLRCRTRQEDILLLAEFFIRNSNICPEKKGRIKGLTKLAAETLLRHHWPGNVRELRNVIERAILLEASDRIGTSTLILHPENFDQPQAETGFSVGLHDFSLEKAEKELVKKALEEAGWQKTRAASLLGITRATLYAKVKQYNIQEPAPEIPQPV
jgi:transcriptional regulator with PAS, ATPase and Fis domain